MNKETFKATIIKQWKKRNSPFRCLLSTSKYDKRVQGDESCLSSRPISLYASEYDVSLSFRWEQGDKVLSIPSMVYTYKRVQQIRFIDTRVKGAVIDISKQWNLDEIRFVEEAIDIDNDEIVFCLRSFRVKHNDYHFYKSFDGERYFPCRFNLRTKLFDDTEYLVAHQWTKVRNKQGYLYDFTYMDIEVDEHLNNGLRLLLQRYNWTQKEIDFFISVFHPKYTDILPSFYWVYKKLSDEFNPPKT